MLRRLETLRSRVVLKLSFGLAGVMAIWPLEAEMNFVLRLETTTPEEDALDAVLDDVDDEVVAF